MLVEYHRTTKNVTQNPRPNKSGTMIPLAPQHGIISGIIRFTELANVPTTANKTLSGSSTESVMEIASSQNGETSVTSCRS